MVTIIGICMKRVHVVPQPGRMWPRLLAHGSHSNRLTVQYASSRGDLVYNASSLWSQRTGEEHPHGTIAWQSIGQIVRFAGFVGPIFVMTEFVTSSQSMLQCGSPQSYMNQSYSIGECLVSSASQMSSGTRRQRGTAASPAVRLQVAD